MPKDIRDVDTIKGAIEIILEFIREIYDADIAAVFLIVKDMHEDEKMFWFEERLKYIKTKYDREGARMPDVLNKYWEDYSKKGPDGLLRHLKEIDILKFCFREAQKNNPSIVIDATIEPQDRLWKYTYKKRPLKWVVFNEYKDLKLEKSILNEGLTAYAVRSGQKILIPGSANMDKYPCLTHLNAEVHITPECMMVAFFPLPSQKIESGEIIGLLKIENYADIPDRCTWFDDSTGIGKGKRDQIQKQYLPALIKLIEKSQEFSEEFSYEELYGVSPRRFLEKLPIKSKPTSSSSTVQNDILEKTIHLLQVLERKEYVGHKEIMFRVTKYADDIAEDIGISKFDFFNGLLEDRKKHEELMLYETEGYRDHFMHSFHVFLLGYIILHHIGKKQICEWLEKSLGCGPAPYNKLKPSNDGILRIWFLTAFLHDAAYVFQKFNEGIANFTAREWGYPLNILPNGTPLLKVDDNQMPFGTYLAQMLEFFASENETNRCLMLSHYLQAIRMNDHGVLGALWMLNKFEKDASLERKSENYLSALAISFHNRIIFRHLREEAEKEKRISLEKFPIPFLLAFCDTAQIWGRRTKEMQEDVKAQLLDIDLSDKQITLKVFYASKVVGNIPSSIDVQGINNVYKSSHYKCEIKFFGGEKPDTANMENPGRGIDRVSFY